jgi:twitching motility protein PilT
LIRDDKVHQIYSSMQAGKKFGMQTLNDALYALYMNREVTAEEALRVTSAPEEFQRMIGQEPVGKDAVRQTAATRPIPGAPARR